MTLIRASASLCVALNGRHVRETSRREALSESQVLSAGGSSFLTV
jgi:hypothetical protein